MARQNAAGSITSRLINYAIAGAAGAVTSTIITRILTNRDARKFAEELDGMFDVLAGETEEEPSYSHDGHPHGFAVHLLVSNPDAVMTDILNGTSLVKSIEGARLPDGDAHMVGVVDREGEPFYGMIWGLEPIGDTPNFEASVEAWRNEVDAYPGNEENMERVENVGGIFFYAGIDHPHLDLVDEWRASLGGEDDDVTFEGGPIREPEEWGNDNGEWDNDNGEWDDADIEWDDDEDTETLDEDTLAKELRRIVRNYVYTEIFEKRRSNVEERLETDVDAILRHVESEGSYLSSSPRRRWRRLLNEL